MPKSSKKLTRPSKKTKKTPTPNHIIKIARMGTKSALIFDILSQASGATIKDLAAASNWQEHSVRGFISGTLKKKLAFNVTSEIINEVRRYKISQLGVQ
jgi:Protein of unknown function (DUF3489)